MALFVNYQFWMHDYPPVVPPSAVDVNAPPPPPLDSTVPTANQAAATSYPAAAAPAVPDTTNVTAAGAVTDANAPSVHVVTDVLDVDVSLAGGEIKSYVKLNEDARRQALDRMVANAAAMGANAVTMMRFDSTDMGAGRTEIGRASCRERVCSVV